MSCRHCHRFDCPGCILGQDCPGCGYRFDADHLDDRGRCGECVEKRAAEPLPTVPPPVCETCYQRRCDDPQWCAAERVRLARFERQMRDHDDSIALDREVGQ